MRCRETRGAMQRSHKRAPVWVTIQMGASPVPPRFPFPLARPFPSRFKWSALGNRSVRHGGATRNLSLVENHRGNKVKAPSGTSHYRIPNRNYEPWPAGYVPGEPRADNRSPVTDSRARSKGVRRPTAATYTRAPFNRERRDQTHQVERGVSS